MLLIHPITFITIHQTRAFWESHTHHHFIASLTAPLERWTAFNAWCRIQRVNSVNNRRAIVLIYLVFHIFYVVHIFIALPPSDAIL